MVPCSVKLPCMQLCTAESYGVTSTATRRRLFVRARVSFDHAVSGVAGASELHYVEMLDAQPCSFFVHNPSVRTPIDRATGGLFVLLGARLAWSR
jgi:hypothetical protein